MGFLQENSVSVSSLRLDYYSRLGLVFRVRLSHFFLSFVPLFSFTLSVLSCLFIILEIGLLKALYFDPLGFILIKI